VLAGEGTLLWSGLMDRSRDICCSSWLSLRRTFGKRAVQVLRDGAPHVGDFNPVVVVGVKQMCSKLLTARALVPLGIIITIIKSCG